MSPTFRRTALTVLFASLLVGVLLLAIVGALPGIGLVINTLSLVLGLGAILTLAQAQFRVLRRASGGYAPDDLAARAIPSSPAHARQLPPVLDDAPASPGMDNLPKGFEWWDD